MKKICSSAALALALVLSLASCQSNGPKATAEKFLNGFYHMDYAAAKKVSDSETIRQLEAWESVMGTMSSQAQKDEAKKIKVSIKEPVVKDSTATVEYSTDKEPGPRTLRLVKRNGKWLTQWSKMEGGGGDSNTNGGGLNNGAGMTPPDTVAAPPADGTMVNPSNGAGTMDNGGASGTNSTNNSNNGTANPNR